jgi:hypothetical protein
MDKMIKIFVNNQRSKFMPGAERVSYKNETNVLYVLLSLAWQINSNMLQ